MAELAEYDAGFAKGGPGPLLIEVILRCDAHQSRPRGAHREIIDVLHAESDLAGDVLLGVLRADRGEETFERGDVAGRGGTNDAVVESHEVRGHGAAAGVAGTADLA